MVLPLDRIHSWGRLEYFILECFSIRVTGVWMSMVCIDKSGGAAKLESYLGISLLDIIFASILLCPWTFRCVKKCLLLWLLLLMIHYIVSCRQLPGLGCSRPMLLLPTLWSCFPKFNIQERLLMSKRTATYFRMWCKSTVRFIPLSELSTYQICSVSPVHPMAASLTQGARLTCSAECDWQLLTAWITI